MKSNSLEICWTIKENLALCEEGKRENLEFQEELHEANMEFIASLADAEKCRCTSNRCCFKPWSRYLQSTGGFILVVLEVMFMIKVGNALHHYDTRTARLISVVRRLNVPIFSALEFLAQTTSRTHMSCRREDFARRG